MRQRLNEWPAGAARKAVWLVLCTLVPVGFAAAQSSGGSFTLRKHVIGAGVVAQGSLYRITATMGQAHAAVATGGSYSLTAGFHQPLPDGVADRIFCNGFEGSACLLPTGASQ